MNLTVCQPASDDQHRSGYVLGFQYDLDVVEDLKRLIPHTYRSWDADNKTWWVSKEYEAVLVKLFKNFEALTKWQGKLAL